jgi:hypothetical protein
MDEEQPTDGRSRRMTHPGDDIAVETPEVDAAEQAATVVPGPDDEGETPEQDRIVEFDDDYR